MIQSMIVRVVLVFSLMAGATWISGTWGCGGGGNSVCGDEGEVGCTPDGETVTLSGQVAVRSSDISALGAQGALKTSSVMTAPKFATIGDTVLADASVTLVKKTAAGDSNVASTTTDSAGNYTLSEVPVCQTGTGTSSDFYYEIQVTDGDLTVKAPACPSAAIGDEAVNVSIETNLAANIISSVVDVPGTEDNPVPSPTVFTELRELTAGNVDDIKDSITIPPPTDEDGTDRAANGMAAAGGDAEKSYKKFQFDSEYVLMTAGADIGTEEGASYLARVAREGCETDSAALPQAAAEAMADALTSGTTFTPQEIVAAVNAVNEGADVTVDSKVTDYRDKLAAIEDAESPSALVLKFDEALDDEIDLGVFFTKKDLTSAAFSADTELKADQAVSFLTTFASSENCNFGNTSMTQMAAALTGSDALTEPAIDNVVIYNDSGFGCVGAGQGHFRAQVDVYLPAGDARTINSVAISSTDGTALGGDGAVTLLQDGPPTRYKAQQDGDCVTLDQEVTYTITATLSDSSTAAKTVVRTHPQTMESVISMNGVVMVGGSGSTTVTPDARPTICWTPPEEIMAAYADPPPEGSQVKYNYAINYFENDGSPDGNSLAATGDCPMPGNSSSLYATNCFIPLADCDVAACAAAAGLTPDKIFCQIMVQTYLLDAHDQWESQAAGAFRGFCIDLDLDGDCG